MTPHNTTQKRDGRNVSLKLTHSEYANLKARAYGDLSTISKYIRTQLCQPTNK
jgi:hypothetical protein